MGAVRANQRPRFWGAPTGLGILSGVATQAVGLGWYGSRRWRLHRASGRKLDSRDLRRRSGVRGSGGPGRSRLEVGTNYGDSKAVPNRKQREPRNTRTTRKMQSVRVVGVVRGSRRIPSPRISGLPIPLTAIPLTISFQLAVARVRRSQTAATGHCPRRFCWLSQESGGRRPPLQRGEGGFQGF